MKLPQFKDPSLLELALTHRSALNEKDSGSSAQESNERLEFLGDAVLELATTLYLFNTYPEEPEGKLTAFRSSLVKTTTLAEVARNLNLGTKMYMSKGEEATGGRDNDSLLADTTEALIGAIYLDKGFAEIQKFLKKHLFYKFEEIKAKKLYRDPKSLLQEVVQAQGFPTPVYEVVKEFGPDHDKEFTVQVVVGEDVKGKGVGRSKQTAEQEAAKEALTKYDY